jgi:hypothetical protein
LIAVEPAVAFSVALKRENPTMAVGLKHPVGIFFQAV